MYKKILFFVVLAGGVSLCHASYWGIDDYFCQVVLINDTPNRVWVVSQDRGKVAELAIFVTTNAATTLGKNERWRIIAPAYIYQDTPIKKDAQMRKLGFTLPNSSMDRIGILYEGYCVNGIRKKGKTDIRLSTLKREHDKMLKAEKLAKEKEQSIAAQYEERNDYETQNMVNAGG